MRRKEVWDAYQAIEEWLTLKRNDLEPGEVKELEQVSDELWEYLSRRPWYKRVLRHVRLG